MRKLWPLVFLALASCETFTGPVTSACHWHYTKAEGQVVFDSTGSETVKLVNTDSTWVCKNPGRE